MIAIQVKSQSVLGDTPAKQYHVDWEEEGSRFRAWWYALVDSTLTLAGVDLELWIMTNCCLVNKQ